MTEAEWLVCIESEPMLECVKSTASERKMRLFAVACCHQVWYLLANAHCRAAIDVAERFADGFARSVELEAALQAVRETEWNARRPHYTAYRENASYWVAQYVVEANVRAGDVARLSRELASREEMAFIQCATIRDIFGNPFRPVTLDPIWLAWHDGTIPKLAAMIYNERRFGDLPVLADALEEAGCTNEAILRHCRTPGEHVRGCWVVDLLLGKQ
jgi:hypothetical protein